MSSVARVTIDPSQFPENVRRDLLESLRARKINHKFHYDSLKQAQKWLAVHQAYAPSRTDADCALIYDLSFSAATSQIASTSIHLLGLGCGGGQKDTRLLRQLQQAGKQIAYTPSDVSVPLALTARAAALAVVADGNCHPLVCDLESAADLPAIFDRQTDPAAARLITFFGMIPNFEPGLILPGLAALVRPADYLLFSANLAPGPDYAAGIKQILPLYDNGPTCDWLTTFLLDLGVERDDGEIRFIVEDDPTGGELKRIAAYFHFGRVRHIQVDEELFKFQPGESIRLFFSYRHTPAQVRKLLGAHGLKTLDQWIAKSGEEGVFFCRRA